jgi:hypothetical protein
MTLGNMRGAAEPIRRAMPLSYKLWFAAAACAAAVTASPAQAPGRDLSPGANPQAINEVVDEMLECAAYITQVAACTSPDPVTAKIGKTATHDLLEKAGKFSRAVGVLEDELLRRGQLAGDKVQRSLGPNCININDANDRYGTFCVGLHNDWAVRYAEILLGQTCTRTYRCGP